MSAESCVPQINVPQINDITYPLLVASHDAGGAAVLAAWCQRHIDPLQTTFLLAGPALECFSTFSENGKWISKDVLTITEYATVITSISAPDADFERLIIKQSREAGVHVATMLDHWGRWQERFVVDGQHYWPNVLLVNDTYAFERASQQFPSLPLVQCDSYYLNDQVTHIKALDNSAAVNEQHRILFVTEPSTGYCFDEFDIMQRFLRDWQRDLNIPTHQSGVIRLRLHPREHPEKYNACTQSYGDLVTYSEGTSLYEDIAWANTVVGCQTMAMVVALQAGRRVCSVLPESVESIALPHTTIERLYPSYVLSRSQY